MNRPIFVIQILLLPFTASFSHAQYYRVINSMPWVDADSNDKGFIYVVEHNDSLFKIVSKVSDSVYYGDGVKQDSIYELDLYRECSPFNIGEIKLLPGSSGITSYNGVDVQPQFHKSLYSIKRAIRVNSSSGLFKSSLKRCGSFLIDSRDSTALYHSPGDTLVIIPNGVKRISSYVFNFDSLIQTVVLPESVVSIGDYAFDGCWKLTSIRMPDSVKAIGNMAFNRCYNMRDFSLPKYVEKLGYKSFYKCLSIRKVVLPKTLKEIGLAAFEGCENLKIVENKSFLKLKKGSSENGCVAKYCRRIINK